MSLEVGDVFLVTNRTLSGTEPHYHVVVYKTTDNKIVVVYTTSNLDGTLKSCKRDEESFSSGEPITYVEVNPKDCPKVIKHKSAISCNKVQMKETSAFESEIGFTNCNCQIDVSILQKIVKGIPFSATVSPQIIKEINKSPLMKAI